MANVNDTHNTAAKLENQWEMLHNADIDRRDRAAIEEFVRLHRKGIENRTPNTLINDLSTLRNAAKRADTPLVEMDLAAARRLMYMLTAPENEGGYGVDSVNGLYSYVRAFRCFFPWLDEHPDYDGDFGFADKLELPSKDVNKVSNDDLLTEQEIQQLKDAATNVRDKTLIDFMADTAARVSLAAQLRVGDIHDLDTERPTYTPNPEGKSQKGTPIEPNPILNSRAELRAYLNRHHIDRRPEAPLWHVLRGYDHNNPEKGALSNDRIRDMLRECKARAGIDKPVNPHNFRHTCLTRLSKAGYKPKQIRHIAGWQNNKMLEIYDHTTATEQNENIFVQAGFLDEAEAKTTEPMPTTCGNCRETIRAHARFCPNCGTAATETARKAMDEQTDRLFESATAANGELAEAVREFRQLTDEYPVLRAAILDD